MFLITEQGVREQDGEPLYYLFPDDIDYLAQNLQSCKALLDELGAESIIVGTTHKPGNVNLSLDNYFTCGSGVHSKL